MRHTTRSHRRASTTRRVALRWALLAAILVAGCSVVTTERAREAGTDVEVELGRQAIIEYGCGTCHTIPGVRGADGLVGPPLTRFGRRGYIAGRLANTPDNLARWIENPDEVDPQTAMPNLGVTPEEAANIAAYLHSLD